MLAFSAVMAGVGGRLLGLRELFLVAAGLATLVVGATVYVWLRRFDVRPRRSLLPGRMPVGASCRVEISLTNRARTVSPLLELSDGSRRPVLVGPMAPGDSTVVAYNLEGRRRGVVPVGPVRMRLTDPFGVAWRTATVLAPSPLTVYPRLDHVVAPPDAGGSPTVAGPRQLAASPMAGADFHALRPYVEGDDLRRVHWPTSARIDQLVVRQDEPPSVRQTVVAVDLRRRVHGSATLERLVSAAASVAKASIDADGLVTLVTTGNIDSGLSGGEAHLDAILDHLATVGADSSVDLESLVVRVAGTRQAVVVFLTTTAVSRDDVYVAARLGAHCPRVVMVLFDRDGVTGLPVPGMAADWIVPVPAGAAFSGAWNRALAATVVEA